MTDELAIAANIASIAEAVFAFIAIILAVIALIYVVPAATNFRDYYKDSNQYKMEVEKVQQVGAAVQGKNIEIHNHMYMSPNQPTTDSDSSEPFD